MQQNNRHEQSFNSKGNCVGHLDQSLEPKYSFSKFSSGPAPDDCPLPQCPPVHSVHRCGVWCVVSPGRDNIQYVTNIPHHQPPPAPAPRVSAVTGGSTELERGGRYLPFQTFLLVPKLGERTGDKYQMLMGKKC